VVWTCYKKKRAKNKTKRKRQKIRPTERPRKRWIDEILEALGNITDEEANRRAKNSNLSLQSTMRGNDKWKKMK
jgi:hypothetical protein